MRVDIEGEEAFDVSPQSRTFPFMTRDNFVF